MKMLNFSWDKIKAKSNLIKHKVSFEEAKTVFDDDNARLIYDPDHSDTEDRFIMLGLSCKLKILTVVHCSYRDDGVTPQERGQNNIRIISARKSTKSETKQYKEYLS
jgi:uncharacterized DUF497 family protein